VVCVHKNQSGGVDIVTVYKSPDGNAQPLDGTTECEFRSQEISWCGARFSPVSLGLLEKNVDAWIGEQKKNRSRGARYTSDQWSID
jgi:hypothetical protein